MAIRLADTARPNNYVDAEHLGTFPVAYAEDVWFTDGTRLSEKTFSGSDVQVEELPLASEDELGNVYQYIGETGTYQHGCFYECVENSGEYSWQFLDVVGKVVYNVETPPTFDSDEISYNDGTVFVFSGDDAHGFLKGHHYKYMEDFTIENINHVIFNLNSEHTTTMHVYMEESNIKVGTMLYRHYNGQEKYESGLTVVAIEENIVTLWDDPANTEIICEYGYSIEPTTNTANVAFGYIDIGGGGGGDYQFSEDFVNEDNNVSLATTQRIFTGTQAEWDELTTEVKTTYGQVNITDDESASEGYFVDATKFKNIYIENQNANTTEAVEKEDTFTIPANGLYRFEIRLSNIDAGVTTNHIRFSINNIDMIYVTETGAGGWVSTSDCCVYPLKAGTVVKCIYSLSKAGFRYNCYCIRIG